jgi:hypothetical protein
MLMRMSAPQPRLISTEAGGTKLRSDRRQRCATVESASAAHMARK